jgi:hypothetical protein
LFLVADQYENDMDASGMNTTPTRKNAEVHSLLEKALSAFESWPDNYWEFLGLLQEHADGPRSVARNGRTGLHKHFGTFYGRLYKHFAASQFDFMRDAFSEYVYRNWRGGYTGHLNRRQANDSLAENKKYLSKGEAVRRLKISEDSLFRFIEMGKLKVFEASRGRTRMLLIDADSLDGLRRELDQTFSVREAADHLGVALGLVRAFVRRGLLSLVRGSAADGSKNWRLCQKSVEELLSNIRGNITPKPAAYTGPVASFMMALRAVNGLNAVTFLEAIIGGEVSPCGEGSGMGLNRFLFYEADVRSYMRKRRVPMSIAA